jgi:hypothetical protein
VSGIISRHRQVRRAGKAIDAYRMQQLLPHTWSAFMHVVAVVDSVIPWCDEWQAAVAVAVSALCMLQISCRLLCNLGWTCTRYALAARLATVVAML